MKRRYLNSQGSTLVELLIVISIMAILSSVTAVVMNGQRHVGEARNMKRGLDVRMFSLAFYDYALDNGGDYPLGITETPIYICRFDALDCTGLLDVSYLKGKYLTMPVIDPKTFTENSTGYTVQMEPGGHLMVNAPHSENSAIVSSRR